MARLGIDATSVAAAGKGISRVQRRTVEALGALGRHELVVFARAPEELPDGEVWRAAGRPALVWEQVGLERAVREHALDAMLTWTERLPLRGSGRYLVWLFEPPTHRIRQNRVAGAGLYQRGSDLVTLALWKRSLARAARVLTGSQATADALEVPARVLYPGLDPAFSPAPGSGPRPVAGTATPPAPADAPQMSATATVPGTGARTVAGTAGTRGSAGERYVLHIGSDDPRDDTETALAAFAAARERTGVRLLVAGGYSGAPRDGVEFLGRVSDEELLALYRGAAAYLDASLYEGFGFQVLEALGCGAPVVATRVTSIPEIAGDAALLVEPRAPAAMGDALVRVLEDEELAADLRRRGPERARAFTWERTAAELADAVDEVVA